MSTIASPRVAALVLLTLTTSLAACGAPDLGPRPQLRPPSSLESAGSISGTSAEWPRQRWWTAYGDPQLDALVDEAVAASPDLATALARIRQAQGILESSRSSLLPQVGARGSASVEKQSYNNGSPPQALPRGWNDYGLLALSADLNLDIWGKNRALLAAATSVTEAAIADARQTELALASQVVASYFDLARLIERQKVLESSLAARETSAGLVGRRVAQGIENQATVRQSNALAARARVDVAANREQIELRRHALAALLGAGPDRTLTLTPPPIADIAATPVPADAAISLAGRRPDIVMARRLVEASDKGVEYARKSFLPDISLSGLIGLSSLGISNLFDDGSDFGNAGAAISLPIFQGGKLSGQYRSARAGYDSTVASYNKAVIGALQDVADALSTRASAAEQERHALVARTEANAAYDLAVQRYEAGLNTYIDALDVETTALDARLAAVDAHFATLASEVALKRALGGGYADESSKKAPIDE
ncbi:efflux transporter outer membrane subunit [Novosphingobium panipatense]|uniref:Efflux transporter, outer membrane factor (OMF) lipoprotein, NodT family n=1 Tax=Novosphingobium panipatense TaxID=428991 RepID=A0ABY1PXA9_9SPHN|nr:efflux transporter outer membrane subunit [Novosphingobium panipatense]SMP51909.1 efflux transporter, outer membrane factor (OMF) lipoprotein, NodT family [Novosphingobium panipatense]